jgi:hypothetical protein
MADGGDGNVLAFPGIAIADPIEDGLYVVDHTVKHEVDIVRIEPKPSPAQHFLTRLQEISDANVQTAIRKNSDYANPDRPFANFEAAPLIGVSVPRGMLVRMQDKLQRISNLLDRPACNESILDSCDDLSNYANILRIWLEQHHGKPA